MSILNGLLAELKEIKQTLEDITVLKRQVEEGMVNMSDKANEIKALIGAISSDIAEASGDMDELLEKVNAITNLPTEAEWNEIKDSLTGIKDSIRAVANKVPEPAPPEGQV